MSNKFNNERQPDVIDAEKTNAKSFLSNFGMENKEFTERDWFKVLVECMYAFHAQPGKSFRLTNTGRANIYCFSSLDAKKIVSFDTEKHETGEIDITVTNIDYLSNNVFDIHGETIAQMMAEITNKTRPLVYITYEAELNSVINQEKFKMFSNAVKAEA